jgi:phage-related tail protein
MTDEERAAANKAAVDAMKNAKANMGIALERIAALESALGSALSALRQAKDDISPRVYAYKADNQNQQTVHARIDAQIASLSKVL